MKNLEDNLDCNYQDKNLKENNSLKDIFFWTFITVGVAFSTYCATHPDFIYNIKNYLTNLF